ncbi:ABC transporter permease subunit [Microbacterium sp. SYP-A9085]|uniref:ABC transporter permease n=1 Tax=Microbacterium sp. SYP-A9085 TaxID=2664454 RepID=UPI00129BE140|nr:ABC transporter permease [Microbacterium sp. SYP-A9085]MRH28054.1 ABC transporter permease subunit [Microbacterium sp. SYP-A9085]
MTGFLLRRLGQFLPVLALAAIAVWAVVYALPGDPTTVLGGLDATPEQIAAIRERLGLDQPVHLQFLTWLTHTLQGDLGTSSTSGFPVTQILAGAIPATAQLAVLAMLITVAVAIPLGMIAALAPRAAGGRIVKGWLSLSLATPPFWMGLLLVIAFSVGLRALPAASRFVPVWEDPAGALRNMILPALALGVYSGGVLARFVAASLSEVMESDYIRTARSKGASPTRVVVRHAMRNSLLPALTVGGLQLGSLLGGAVVIEVLFSYSGIGRLLFNAVAERDYAILQATIMFVVVVFLVINLVIDVLYAVLDPRIRLK